MNNNVFSCLLNAGSKDAAVIDAGKLFHARAAVTWKEQSPMMWSRVRGTISRWREPERLYCSTSASSVQCIGGHREMRGRDDSARRARLIGNLFFPEHATSAGHGADVWCNHSLATSAHDRQDEPPHLARTGDGQAGDHEYQSKSLFHNWITSWSVSWALSSDSSTGWRTNAAKLLAIAVRQNMQFDTILGMWLRGNVAIDVTRVSNQMFRVWQVVLLQRWRTPYKFRFGGVQLQRLLASIQTHDRDRLKCVAEGLPHRQERIERKKEEINNRAKYKVDDYVGRRGYTTTLPLKVFTQRNLKLNLSGKNSRFLSHPLGDLGVTYRTQSIARWKAPWSTSYLS